MGRSGGRTYDQIGWLLKEIRRNPNSRRLVVSAWNVAEIERMKLAPCHCLFQFYVGGGKLSCQLYQRSADIFLGVPFNIASYALLTHLIARECGLGAGEFVHTFGDAHLYLNHVDQAREQLAREPRPCPTSCSATWARSSTLNADAIAFEGYDPWPAIRRRWRFERRTAEPLTTAGGGSSRREDFLFSLITYSEEANPRLSSALLRKITAI